MNAAWVRNDEMVNPKNLKRGKVVALKSGDRAELVRPVNRDRTEWVVVICELDGPMDDDFYRLMLQMC